MWVAVDWPVRVPVQPAGDTSLLSVALLEIGLQDRNYRITIEKSRDFTPVFAHRKWYQRKYKKKASVLGGLWLEVTFDSEQNVTVTSVVICIEGIDCRIE